MGLLSQSPQTGQVYFNGDPYLIVWIDRWEDSLNPLKRVKFISIYGKVCRRIPRIS